MAFKTALITGITGQDGAAMAGFLRGQGYRIFGLRPYLPVEDTERLTDILPDITLLYGDLSDSGSLIRALETSKPDEIYNFAAQSHVRVSFDIPETTMDINAVGVLRLLEAMRTCGLGSAARFYQASSSEMFGSAPAPQNEETPFAPCSPYGIAKTAAYWTVRMYRNAYGFHASNGILFNHEGPMRGAAFVTRKIAAAVARQWQGDDAPLFLGNLEARRDWGHVDDYVRGIHAIIQQDTPDDYVLATGQSHSVRDFVEAAYRVSGVDITWQGEGQDEAGLDTRTGRVLVRIDPALYRPFEIDELRGDASKARRVLGWTPRISFEDMVEEMVRAEMPAGSFDIKQKRYG